MTVLGSNAAYRTLRADHLTRVPAGVDAAEAAALILSWTTAYQLLHRAARVQRGQRVLVQGAAGAVAVCSAPTAIRRGRRRQRRMLTMLAWVTRLYLWNCLPGGKRARGYSINVMRARHPAWFREDLERLFGLLATRAIQPRVAERISFDEVGRGAPPSRGGRSRGQARPMPGPRVATRPGAASARAAPAAVSTIVRVEELRGIGYPSQAASTLR